MSNRALALLKQRRPELARKSFVEVSSIIRREMANEIQQAIRNLPPEQTKGLGMLAGWLQHRQIQRDTQMEYALKEREKAEFERIQQRKAAQYGISVAMLQEFIYQKFQAQVRDWEAERNHERQKDLHTHQTKEQIRYEKAQGKIQRRTLTHTTDQSIRLQHAAAKIQRANKRNETFWDTAAYVVRSLIEVGSEIVKTNLQRQQLENQIRYAAASTSVAEEYIAQRKMEEARKLNQAIKDTTDPFERKLYKARLEGLLKELGLGTRPRKASHGQNTPGTNAHRNLRTSSRKRAKNSAGNKGKPQ